MNERKPASKRYPRLKPSNHSNDDSYANLNISIGDSIDRLDNPKDIETNHLTDPPQKPIPSKISTTSKHLYPPTSPPTHTVTRAITAVGIVSRPATTAATHLDRQIAAKTDIDGLKATISRKSDRCHADAGDAGIDGGDGLGLEGKMPERLPKTDKKLTFAEIGLMEGGAVFTLRATEQLNGIFLSQEDHQKKLELDGPRDRIQSILTSSVINKSSVYSTNLLEKLRNGAKRIQIQARLSKFFQDSIKDETKADDLNLFSWKDFVEKRSHDSLSKQQSSKTLQDPASPGLTPNLTTFGKIGKVSEPSTPLKFNRNQTLKHEKPSLKPDYKPGKNKKQNSKCKSFFLKCLKSTIMSYIYTAMIIISIFGDDTRRLLISHANDIYFDIGIFIIMLIFTIEIIYNIVIYGTRYVMSPDLWFDSIATLSIVVEFSVISEPYLAPYEKYNIFNLVAALTLQDYLKGLFLNLERKSERF